VVAGMKDPNPRVAGRGFQQLRRAGIRVRAGLLESECRVLNEAFVKYITERRPFVTLKLAATLDGKIASVTGDARWISGEDSRRTVHRLRNQMDAVIVGIGTVLADNPQLTCRIPGGRNPWRVVLDSRLRVPANAQVFRQRDPEKTIVVTGGRALQKKIRLLEARGAKVWKFRLRGKKIPWPALLNRLAGLGITSALIEGGAVVAASAIKDKAVDKIVLFYAAKILGGDGRPMIDNLGIRTVDKAVPVERLKVLQSGGDLMVSAYL